eukprot:1763890-Prymnesium_polylepis.1
MALVRDGLRCGGCRSRGSSARGPTAARRRGDGPRPPAGPHTCHIRRGGACQIRRGGCAILGMGLGGELLWPQTMTCDHHPAMARDPVSYTHLRAHETLMNL